ncbi:hypothetical protein EIM92_01955 [Paenibacillus lentus]|uniref:DUF3923 family protein n=1 Tax=Paenibacillus lentus TaxID=1338368 RepID=A0A3S8RQA1_9BACL|nr:hypothetical protein EIM92_01955 [Paenibacillus lentus]
MKYKFLNLSIFVISVICLIISMQLFWNINIYVDGHNTNPSIVLGGKSWLIAYWIMILFNLLICVLSFINLLKKK